MNQLQRTLILGSLPPAGLMIAQAFTQIAGGAGVVHPVLPKKYTCPRSFGEIRKLVRQ